MVHIPQTNCGWSNYHRLIANYYLIQTKYSCKGLPVYELCA